MTLVESLAPVSGPDTRVLILGSMPGVVSLERQQYYGHPRNRFWNVLGALCDAGPHLPYPDRLARLVESGLGLWDVLRRCAREGSLDASIVRSSEEANEIGALLARRRRVEALAFNGRKAAAAFRRLVLPRLAPPLAGRLALHELPSTSPANAALDLDALVRAWRPITRHLDRASAPGSSS